MENNKKHILALASWYPSRVFLDNGDFIQRYLRAISTKNNVTLIHAIKDITLKNNFEISDKNNHNVREIIIYFKPSIFRPFNLVKQIIAYLKGVKLVKNFDLIHLNVTYPAGIVAVYLKKKYKKPIVLTEHWTIFSPERFIELAFYKKILIKRILEQVGFLTTVSKDLSDKMSLVYKIKKVNIIPNVVDVDLFSVKDQHMSSEKTFLHLSHLGNEHKNIIGMLNVAKCLVDEGYNFKFKIGGNGDLSLIDNFISQNNLSNYIQSFGRLKHEEVNEKMKQADCFVLFSNYENQPCVQIEAFASGIPVIATNVGGISEFFPENFGFIISKNNEEQLYLAMKKVINNTQFSSSKEMNSYAKKNFSTEVISKKIDDVYNNVLR